VADVRLALPADGPAVAALRAGWTAEWSGPVEDEAYAGRFADWWAAEAGRRLTWVAWVDERAVGMMNLAVFDRMPRPGQAPSRWGYLGNAFVLAPWRSQGIGTELLSALLGYARSAGFVRIVLSPSERSIPFYARAGFGPASSLLLNDLTP
jgi:GNAT superfamily N-acetyltransferase